jgi:hypothetical protein
MKHSRELGVIRLDVANDPGTGGEDRDNAAGERVAGELFTWSPRLTAAAWIKKVALARATPVRGRRQ